MPFTFSTAQSTQQSLSQPEDLGVVTSTGSLVLTSIAVLMSGQDARLINDGLIVSGNIAVSATSDVSIVNTGRIVGELQAIGLGIPGVTTTTSVIINSGEIISFSGTAISCFDSGVTINNSGLVSGKLAGISLSLGGTLSNSGTIEVSTSAGNAVASFGTTLMVNTGTILGNVTLSSLGDTLDNRLGEITGNITLGNGNNLFRGGATDEVVTAGSGLDTLRGALGEDTLDGGTGNDLVVGGDGDDSLTGGLNDDTLRGGLGNDTLFGGETADVIYGGRGADSFVFNNISESDTLQVADRIADFDRKEDVIDMTLLSLVTSTPLSYVGTGAFVGGGVSSVGHARVGGLMVVSVDSDGNAIADMAIHVTVTGNLTAANFLL